MVEGMENLGPAGIGGHEGTWWGSLVVDLVELVVEELVDEASKAWYL